MNEDDRVIPIAAGRLAQLRRALALASGGGFDPALELLATETDDDFGAFEQDLRAFIVELRVAIAQSEEAITELSASKQELQEKLAMIERQRAAIRELSTPVIDVWDGVVTVPLIGLIDSARVQDLSERLLAHIAASGTAWILLDMTGIDFVDSTIANHLIQLARAVRLMGARCLLTGIRPRVAQTFVTLGIALDELQPMASLEQGLKHVLTRGR